MEERYWTRFVSEYSSLISKIIRKFVKDREQCRNIYAKVLESLRNGKLDKFDGKSSLTTWLFIVTKRECIDYFRGKTGVRHLNSLLKDLECIDKRYFDLFYIQGLRINEVYQSMRLEWGNSISYLDLIECDRRIRQKIKEKNMGKILDRLLNPDGYTVSLRGMKGQSLHPDIRLIHPGSMDHPGSIIDRHNLQLALQNLREAVNKLPHRDRLILHLRFEHKASARQICEILDLKNEKQAYRKLDKLLHSLKDLLSEKELPPEVYSNITRNMEELCSTCDGDYPLAEGGEERLG